MSFSFSVVAVVLVASLSEAVIIAQSNFANNNLNERGGVVTRSTLGTVTFPSFRFAPSAEVRVAGGNGDLFGVGTLQTTLNERNEISRAPVVWFSCLLSNISHTRSPMLGPSIYCMFMDKDQLLPDGTLQKGDGETFGAASNAVDNWAVLADFELKGTARSQPQELGRNLTLVVGRIQNRNPVVVSVKGFSANEPRTEALFNATSVTFAADPNSDFGNANRLVVAAVGATVAELRIGSTFADVALSPTPAPTPRPTPNPPGITPMPTPAPSPSATSPCSAFTICAQCIDTSFHPNSICRFCSGACVALAVGCANTMSIGPGGTCPTTPPTPVPTPAPTRAPTAAPTVATTTTSSATTPVVPSPQPSPRPTPRPSPVPEGLPCTSYSASCGQCVSPSRACSFCGSACQDAAIACSDVIDVRTSGTCPTVASTPAPTLTSAAPSDASLSSSTASVVLTSAASADGIAPNEGVDSTTLIAGVCGGVAGGLLLGLCAGLLWRSRSKRDAASPPPSKAPEKAPRAATTEMIVVSAYQQVPRESAAVSTYSPLELSDTYSSAGIAASSDGGSSSGYVPIKV